MKLFRKVNDFASDFTTYPKSFEGYKWYKPIFVGVLSVIIYIILSLLFEVIILKTFNFDIAVSDVASSLSFDNPVGILTSLIIVLLIPSIFISSKILHERPFSSYLSIRGWSWEIFFKASALTLLVYILIMIFQIFVLGLKFNNHFTIITFFLCLIITPFQCFAEEYLFRGFLMQAFGSWFKIPIIAIIIQTVIFTLLHEYNVTGLICIFITGLVLGLIAWYSQGLEVSSAIHSINNIISFCMVGFGFEAASIEISLLDMVFGLACLFISVGLIFLIDKKYDWIGLNKNIN